jgi:GNAT superfamily N-acetyltransferase
MTDNGDPTNNDAPGSMGASPAATPSPENDLRDYSATHILPDGTTILIRAIRRDDKPRFRAAFANLERDSIYRRFMSYKKELTDADFEHATEVDFDRVVALVATVGSGDAEAIIAGARYVSDPGPAPHCNAEIAFLVEEDYQGQGIAGRLLDHLVRIACAKGLSQLYAEVLANNRPMLTVFERSGLPMQRTQVQDVIHVTRRWNGESVSQSGLRRPGVPQSIRQDVIYSLEVAWHGRR